MRSARPGCLSTNGLIAALLTLLIVLGISAMRGGVLYSPGELNAQTGESERGKAGAASSHAELGGRCSACHTAFWEQERMADRCLACHMEILAGGRDFHRIMLAESQGTACTPCHTDHNGPQASLTLMELANFPHDGLGFSLAAHQERSVGREMACRECHGERIAKVDPLVCLNCHSDLQGEYMTAHVQDFGPACLNCHDGLDTHGSAFDHNLLAFPLQGAHALAGCGQCHHPATTLADLRLAPSDCAGCHAEDDAHAGQFGADCAACHTSESWEEATFDHSLTGFPLTGRHQAVECEACHTGGVFKGTSSDCAGCHADPAYHAGQFGTDCSSCHTTQAWSPARYEAAHTFPIDHGEGGPSGCKVCHPQSLDAYTCYGCHEHSLAGIESKHREEGISDFQDCTRCHPTGQEEEGEREGGDD